METILKYIKVAHLLCKERLFGLNGKELQLLEDWRRQSERHEKSYQLFQHLDPEVLAHRYERIDADRQWGEFRSRLAGRRFRVWKAVAGIAAVVCLLLGGSYLFYWNQESVSSPEVADSPMGGIRLVLSSGKTLNLSDRKHLDIRQIEGNAVLHDNQLEYRMDTLTTTEPEYNTLIVPKGAFYHLILADGTKVWLNSDSRIEYPIVFAENRREVTLQGEAFFEVEKDSDKPFMVKTENFNVKVLGTSFNINTYGDDGKVYTALQQGVVEVEAGPENALILAPGQVAELDIRQPGMRMKLSRMSLNQQIAWKEGFFCFRSTPLSDMLKQIERYYDVCFVDAAKVGEEVYTGDISRNVSLEELLDAIRLQTTNIDFRMVDKVVYIIEKRD